MSCTRCERVHVTRAQHIATPTGNAHQCRSSSHSKRSTPLGEVGWKLACLEGSWGGSWAGSWGGSWGGSWDGRCGVGWGGSWLVLVWSACGRSNSQLDKVWVVWHLHQ